MTACPGKAANYDWLSYWLYAAVADASVNRPKRRVVVVVLWRSAPKYPLESWAARSTAYVVTLRGGRPRGAEVLTVEPTEPVRWVRLTGW